MTLFVMVVATLYFGREVLVPVTLALLLAFILAPLVALLRRAHLGRIPSVLLGVILALAIILGIGGVIGSQIAVLGAGLPKYVAAVETKVTSVQQFTIGRLSTMANAIGVARPPAAGASTRPPVDAGTDQPPAPAPTAPAATSSFNLVERYLTPILSPLATLGIVFVVAVFALLQQEDLRDRLIRLLGSDDLHRTTQAMDDGGRRLIRYFLTQLSINTLFGIVIGIGLLLLGLPNPVLWGILSALLRFVPYVGSFIAALLPMALAAAIEPGWSTVLYTLALYVVVEGLTGQLLEPMVYGHSTGLSPFSVVVAAIFWSWLWGPIGLILSTPLTLILVVMGRHMKRLEFLDVMLGDRPALTPVESFYQRILAGDADEVQDQAEILLKQCSLSNYYDEVALKALQMAASDAQRQALGDGQLDQVMVTTKALVTGLDKHDDRQPPPPKKHQDGLDPQDDEVTRKPDPKTAEKPLARSWQGESAVLCIAGRGPLDEAAATMLRQLLGKHGLGGRVVGYGDVARDTVDRLDVDGVAMACISYLDISGSPAHLRFLIQRLRNRLPRGTPILVGLWPTEDTVLKDQNARSTVGADYYSASLEQTVSSCVEVSAKAEALEMPASAPAAA